MPKKLILSLLTAASVLTLGLTACSTKPAVESSQPNADTTAPAAGTTAAQTTTTAAPTTTTTTTATEASSTAPTTATTQASATTDKNAVATLAKSLVGSPYQYGKTGPTEFDNSGFLVYCYAKSGITLPRKTGDIVKKGANVEKGDLKPGDAVFFYNETPGSTDFAGIYIGGNQFVASDKDGVPVTIHNMNLTYFVNHFVCARRF